jgi:2'-5' RNA ligase
MRLFIAIDLPDEVRDYLYDFQKVVGRDDAKINWVAKKNLHLTVKFLGEIDESRLEEVKNSLRAIKFKSFEVTLCKFGAFPDFKFPNVLWVGLKPEQDIVKLAQLVDSETLLFSSADTKFKAHLTIGRVKSIKFKDKFTKKLESISVKEIPFKIDKFSLYKSTLTSQGPQYQVVESYKSLAD